MWVLKRIQEGSNQSDPTHYLIVGEHLVGRKDCTIQVPGDQTVSRKHAYITVNHSGTKQAAAHVTIKDVSKFGTSVNDIKCQNSVNVELKDGDEVIFGTQNSSYRLSCEPLVVFASCLENSKKKSLKTNVAKLGGYMVSEWEQECTHLVMDALSFTVKVIYALVTCCPIVKSSYFEDLLQQITSSSELPLAASYMPPIKEQLIDSNVVSFHPNEARKSLFAGKQFLFLEKTQYKRLLRAITLAGGNALLKECGDVSNDEDVLLTDANTLVMSVDLKCDIEPEKEVWVAHVWDVLTSCLRRPIAETEVGLAILHLSLEEYCNSSMNHIPRITKQIVSKSLSTMEAMSQRVNESQNISAMSITEKRPLSLKTDSDQPLKTRSNTSPRNTHQEIRKRSRDSSGDPLPLVSDTPLSEQTPLESKRQKLSSPVVPEVTSLRHTRAKGQVELISQSHDAVPDSRVSEVEITHISQSEDSHSMPKQPTEISSQGKRRRNLRIPKSEVTHISQSFTDSHPVPKELIDATRHSKRNLTTVKSEVTQSQDSVKKEAWPTSQKIDNLEVSSTDSSSTGERKRRRSQLLTHNNTSHTSPPPVAVPETPSPEISLQEGKRRRVGALTSDITHVSETERSRAEEENTDGHLTDTSFDLDGSLTSGHIRKSSMQKKADITRVEVSGSIRKRPVKKEADITGNVVSGGPTRKRLVKKEAGITEASDIPGIVGSVSSPIRKKDIKEEAITEIESSEVLGDLENLPSPESRYASRREKQRLGTKNFSKSVDDSKNVKNSEICSSRGKETENHDDLGVGEYSVRQDTTDPPGAGVKTPGSAVKIPRSGWISKKASQRTAKIGYDVSVVVKVECTNERNLSLGKDSSLGTDGREKEVDSTKLMEQDTKQEEPKTPVIVVKEEIDVELASNLICIEYVELIVKRTAPRKNHASEENNNDTNLRNTKRFRKQNYPGSGVGLPRIIGGCDLETFSTRSKDVEDWFIEIQQMNRQKDLEDQDADDLFRYEPSKKRRNCR